MTSRRQCSALPARYPPPPSPARQGSESMQQPPFAAQKRRQSLVPLSAALQPSVSRLVSAHRFLAHATPPRHSKQSTERIRAIMDLGPGNVGMPCGDRPSATQRQSAPRTPLAPWVPRRGLSPGTTQLSFRYPCLASAHLMQVHIPSERPLWGGGGHRPPRHKSPGGFTPRRFVSWKLRRSVECLAKTPCYGVLCTSSLR